MNMCAIRSLFFFLLDVVTTNRAHNQTKRVKKGPRFFCIWLIQTQKQRKSAEDKDKDKNQRSLVARMCSKWFMLVPNRHTKTQDVICSLLWTQSWNQNARNYNLKIKEIERQKKLYKKW